MTCRLDAGVVGKPVGVVGRGADGGVAADGLGVAVDAAVVGADQRGVVGVNSVLAGDDRRAARGVATIFFW